MAWSFRRRIKIIPGVHLNLSKSGISTSIGIKGANINIGKTGAYLNTGIPGTGIYQRQKLSGNSIDPQNQFEPFEQSERHIYDDKEIISADVQEITSQGMQGVKDSILLAHQQRTELKRDLHKVKTKLSATRLKLTASYVFIYGLVSKGIPAKIKADISAQKEAIAELENQIQNCFVNLEIDFDEEFDLKYKKLLETFKNLINCHKIWDITNASLQDTVKTRSSAGTLVKKQEVRFGFKSLPDIKFDFDAMYFKNANGADLYFYPNFIVMFSSKHKFAIIGFEELDFFHRSVRFTETGKIPKDSRVIDRTWAKVNKNGTPDKRFKGNYQIPVVKYGEIQLSTDSGVNEEYEFSNYEFSADFANAFEDYQSLIKLSGKSKI
ncbi:MAG: DUF4236 domain-containing protein [Maribacter sp.]|uniref:DUF4236 domain-containing protein n=1 Tax=Maribacter sp. TaxID=1897614 RepID=UPI00329A7CD7